MFGFARSGVAEKNMAGSGAVVAVDCDTRSFFVKRRDHDVRLEGVFAVVATAVVGSGAVVTCCRLGMSATITLKKRVR